jgi:hypothetical protein
LTKSSKRNDEHHEKKIASLIIALAFSASAFARIGETEAPLKSSRVVIRVHEFRAPATAVFDLSGLGDELDKLPSLKNAVSLSVKKSVAEKAEKAAATRKLDAEIARIKALTERMTRTPR